MARFSLFELLFILFVTTVSFIYRSLIFTRLKNEKKWTYIFYCKRNPIFSTPNLLPLHIFNSEPEIKIDNNKSKKICITSFCIVGASHSYLGAIDNRTSDDGTKVSCVHFQCAAGFFQFHLDNLDTTLASDTSQFMLKLFINSMLVR